jgi:outer membrane protein assembly factor BamB
LLLALAGVGADWAGFRGPHGLGVSAERGLPIHWSATENLLWKLKLPGPGASSPIVSGGRVFLTCYSGYGIVKNGDQKDLRRHLLCLDPRTGAVLWQRESAAVLPEARYSGFMTEHGYASSTPAADGQRVYAFFGRTGVLAFDFAGKLLWQSAVGAALNGWGSAASPVLYKDRVLINATIESGSLLALDKQTGQEVWRVKGLLDTWSTPVLVSTAAGDEVVLNTPGTLLGFDPATGKKLWECVGIETSAATSTPLAKDGVVYAMASGVEGRATLAVRAGGHGDVTRTHVLWRQKAGTGISSPVLYDGHLYWVGGQVGCLKSGTGAIVYQERLYEARQEYASPVAADGKLYAFTRRNGGFVLAASGRFERLARNDLGDPSDFSGTPAISDGRLFVRSNEYLYCIGRSASLPAKPR